MPQQNGHRIFDYIYIYIYIYHEWYSLTKYNHRLDMLYDVY